MTTLPTTEPDRTGTTTPVRPNTADRLVRRVSVLAAVADIGVMLLIGELIPPLAAFAVVTVVLFATLRRRTGGLTIGLAVLAAVAILTGVPFWTADLAHPGDTVAFVWTLLSTGSRFVAIIAAVLAPRAAAERGSQLLTAGAIGLLAVGVVTAVVARAGVESTSAETGDVAVTIEGFAFPDAPVQVPSGGTLHVTNADQGRHTFTVVDTDVEVLLLAKTADRVPVDLTPGTYDIVCEVPGHESMAGTLEVE